LLSGAGESELELIEDGLLKKQGCEGWKEIRSVRFIPCFAWVDESLSRAGLSFLKSSREKIRKTCLGHFQHHCSILTTVNAWQAKAARINVTGVSCE
jgi:hypothetical protein